VRVDGVGDGPLRRLVQEQVRGNQPLQEPPEPGITRLERAEVLEQVLSGPVAQVAQDVLFNLPAQAPAVAGEEPRRSCRR
jgi:hypothetical protein